MRRPTRSGVGSGWWLLAGAFAILALVWSFNPRAASAQSADDGESIFEAKCVACHTIGGGRLVGPDLAGVTSRRDRDWLARWLAAPDAVIAGGDPIAIQLLAESKNVAMPNFGFTDAQVASLIAFLDSQTGGTTAAAAPGATTSLSGNADVGKSLFAGTSRLENGGPSCRACHSIAGIGALGGGALGPDLTQAFSKYGRGGIASLLATIPLPTMNPIFGERPLTQDEQADLAAFLEQAGVSGRSTEALGQLVLLAVVGAALLLLLARVLLRGRLTEVRRPVVAGSRTGSRIKVMTLDREEGS